MTRWAITAALVLCGLVASLSADARPWHRGPGWGPYPYGWGWRDSWPYPPYGGYWGPNTVWYVPPLAPEPKVVLPRKRCTTGRMPARWVAVRKDGRTVYQHVMSRCR
jgi:hypothetical protein